MEAYQAQEARTFHSKAMPDYESQQLCIMPSDKRSTVARKPAFASDSLQKKGTKPVPVEQAPDSPKFVF